MSEDIYVNGKIGGGIDRQPMIHEGEYVLRPECRDAAALHEQAYREMGEQQAETRDARRNRDANRPRGKAGGYEEGHVQADKE